MNRQIYTIATRSHDNVSFDSWKFSSKGTIQLMTLEDAVQLSGILRKRGIDAVAFNTQGV